MKTRSPLLFLMLSFALTCVSTLKAEDPPRKTMKLHYSDGNVQAVNLNQPSQNIIKIEFTNEAAVQSTEYTDDKGAKVYVPCGKLSFADKVINYSVGSPAPVSSVQNPKEALGERNYVFVDEANDYGYVTLGCGGTITLEFTNVRIIDGDGVDLHVFEIGPAVEPTQLEISADGSQWINIGNISGGTADVDIHKFVSPGAQFRFLRLMDLKSACGGDWSGADIDAVAAIGCTVVEGAKPK